jgi:hypothetical protein
LVYFLFRDKGSILEECILVCDSEPLLYDNKGNRIKLRRLIGFTNQGYKIEIIRETTSQISDRIEEILDEDE